MSQAPAAEEPAAVAAAAPVVEEPAAEAAAVEAVTGEAAAPSALEVDPVIQADWDKSWTAILELLFAKVSARGVYGEGGLVRHQHACVNVPASR